MKKRIRAIGIVIKENQVLLIHRKNTKEYFVFPGGGVEEEETIEKAVLRELKEETTLDVKIDKLLYRHFYDDGSEQYFYLCQYISGEPKLEENSIEMQKMSEGKEFYKPLWVDIEKAKNLLLFPLEIRDVLMEDFKNNFSSPVKIYNIKISELRETL